MWSCWEMFHAMASGRLPPVRVGGNMDACALGLWHGGCFMCCSEVLGSSKNNKLSFKTSNPCINRVHGCHPGMTNEQPVYEGTLVEVDCASVHHPNEF